MDGKIRVWTWYRHGTGMPIVVYWSDRHSRVSKLQRRWERHVSRCKTGKARERADTSLHDWIWAYSTAQLRLERLSAHQNVKRCRVCKMVKNISDSAISKINDSGNFDSVHSKLGLNETGHFSFLFSTAPPYRYVFLIQWSTSLAR